MLGELVEVVIGPREPEGCGHHWHVSLLGWVCCCCPARVRSRVDAPEHTGRCTQDGPVDELEEWLWDLVEPPATPIIGRKKRKKRRLRAVSEAA